LSHVPSVAAADLEEGVGDLAEGAAADGVHEDGEQVVAGERRGPQPLQRRGALGRVALLEVTEARDLALLLLVGAALELRRTGCLLVGVGSRNVLTPMSGSVPSCLRCS
jgi:hypothetical protein